MRYQNLNLEKLKVVAFDWDNTLALTRAVLEAAVNEVLLAHKLPLWNEIKDKRDKNLSFRDNFPVLFGDKAAVLYEMYRQIYKQKVSTMIKKPLFAGETIEFLRSVGVKMILVTNKDRELLEYELPLLYEPTIFTKIVCGHEAPKDKPFKEQLLFGLDGLVNEVNSASVWMIGDSEMDSACALSAGVQAVRIGTPIWDKEVCKDQENVVYFGDFSEFFRFLRGN